MHLLILIAHQVRLNGEESIRLHNLTVSSNLRQAFVMAWLEIQETYFLYFLLCIFGICCEILDDFVELHVFFLKIVSSFLYRKQRVFDVGLLHELKIG